MDQKVWHSQEQLNHTTILNTPFIICVSDDLHSFLLHDGGERVWQGWLGAFVEAKILKRYIYISTLFAFKVFTFFVNLLS